MQLSRWISLALLLVTVACGGEPTSTPKPKDEVPSRARAPGEIADVSSVGKGEPKKEQKQKLPAPAVQDPQPVVGSNGRDKPQKEDQQGTPPPNVPEPTPKQPPSEIVQGPKTEDAKDWPAWDTAAPRIVSPSLPKAWRWRERKIELSSLAAHGEHLISFTEKGPWLLRINPSEQDGTRVKVERLELEVREPFGLEAVEILTRERHGIECILLLSEAPPCLYACPIPTDWSERNALSLDRIDDPKERELRRPKLLKRRKSDWKRIDGWEGLAVSPRHLYLAYERGRIASGEHRGRPAALIARFVLKIANGRVDLGPRETVLVPLKSEEWRLSGLHWDHKRDCLLALRTHFRRGLDVGEGYELVEISRKADWKNDVLLVDDKQIFQRADLHAAAKCVDTRGLHTNMEGLVLVGDSVWIVTDNGESEMNWKKRKKGEDGLEEPETSKRETALIQIKPRSASEPRLEIVAESKRQWTGVAVSPTGRLFVNYPRWSDDVPVSVAEIVEGKPVPFPDLGWNGWKAGSSPDGLFVCVQSVVFDDEGTLWVLDPANPQFRGVVDGGPKLVAFDIEKRKEKRTIPLGDIVSKGSYLNDVRIDTRKKTAYITDSGDGALIVIDLKTGASRRLLDDHPSTGAEMTDITIEGRPWTRNGKTPQVHADGIALSPGGRWLYYQALTGRTMYRVPTKALRDKSLDRKALEKRVESVANSGIADGLLFDAECNLYLSSLEENAINKLTPTHDRVHVVSDPRLVWPDSFTLGPDGWIYVTTAQIHRGPKPADPYRVWRFKP